MINISDFKQLGIILPNTNKALSHVLTEATHKELESITQGKDLKTILSSLLKQSAVTPESNKELLQLVKNNPTLKNLGDVSTTLKDLLQSLKSDTSQKSPIPLEKVLQTFSSDIKDLKNTQLKDKLLNSGIFLESKLKNVQNPQVELKQTLISLVKNLQTSNSPASRTIANEAKVLLNTEVMKSVKLPINTSVQNTQVPNNATKTINSHTSTNVAPQQNIINANKLTELTNFQSIQIASDKPKVLEELSSKVTTLVKNIQSSLTKADSIHHPAVLKAIQQLEHKLHPKLLVPENFKLTPIKESLEQISLQVSKSFSMDSKSILSSLEKIFQALKPVTNLDTFIDKKIPQMIKSVNEDIKYVVQKAEPLFQKETTALLKSLENLNTPAKLHPQNNIKEIIATDFKAVLLQTADDVVKLNHPNQAEIIKNIDKLSLQIDNFQLLSHLSNGNSLYLPYSWDMMEEGKLEMKKSDNDKFYVDIYLKFKEYGEVNLKLSLYDGNQLNLHVYSSNEGFRWLIQENIPMLRSALIDTQITPREIGVHDVMATHKGTSPYEAQSDNIYMGFEVKA